MQKLLSSVVVSILLCREATSQAPSPEQVLRDGLDIAGLKPESGEGSPELVSAGELGVSLQNFAQYMKDNAITFAAADAEFAKKVKVIWRRDQLLPELKKGEIGIRTGLGGPAGLIFAVNQTKHTALYVAADPGSAANVEARATVLGVPEEALAVGVAGSGSPAKPNGGNASAIAGLDAQAYGGNAILGGNGGTASAESSGGNTVAVGGSSGEFGGGGGKADATSSGKGTATAQGGNSASGAAPGGKGTAFASHGDATARGGFGGSGVPKGGRGGDASATADDTATATAGNGGPGPEGGDGGDAFADGERNAQAFGGFAATGFVGGRGGCARAVARKVQARADGGLGGKGITFAGDGGNAEAECETGTAEAFGGPGGDGGVNGGGGGGGDAGALSDQRAEAVGGQGGDAAFPFGTAGPGGNVMAGALDPKKKPNLITIVGPPGTGFFPGGFGIVQPLVIPLPYCP